MTTTPVMIPERSGPIAAHGAPLAMPGVGPGWLITAWTPGDRHGWRWPSALKGEMARALTGRPVRMARIVGEIDHPVSDDPYDPATKVGVIESAWPERWSVRAVFRLDPDADRLEIALRRMYLDHTLRLLLAFSIVGRIHYDQDLVVTEIARIANLDIVSVGMDREASFLRPLRPGENPTPHKETSP